jgi:uncharacterized Zn finger protein
MAKYGKTYWGSQFLNALLNIDYSNRLPRGRSYASKGSVRSIIFDNNKINAKVKGSRPKPYYIQIVVPKFSDSQKNDLMDVIQNDSTILANLLNRQLPNNLLQIADAKMIKIFPRQWKDFDMYCSCPDSAVPCKHLAAVIYLIAGEIDLNPFKVLELRGLNVLNELTKRGLEVEDDANEKIDSWDTFFTKNPTKHNELPPISDLSELDFTLIPKIEDKFLDLLSPDPPFYEKDFKKELIVGFKYVSRNVDKHHFRFSKKDIEIDLNNCISASLICAKTGSCFMVELAYENEQKTLSITDLFYLFIDEENFSLPRAANSIKVLYHFFLFAKKIINQGAVIPQLSTLNNNVRILWTPLLQDNSVKLQSEILNKYSSYINWINKEKKVVSSFSDSANFSVALTSVFATIIIKDILHKNYRISINEFIPALFFGDAFSYDKCDKEVLNSVQLWLKKIHSINRKYIPVLEIVENYPEFNVSLLIRSNLKEEMLSPVPFNRFKNKNNGRMLAVMKDLVQLKDHFPEFESILKSSDEVAISYNPEKFADFLFQIIPILNLLGVEILIPKALKNIVKPAASLKVTGKGTVAAKTFLDLMSLLNFEWQVAVGNRMMSEEDFLKIVRGTDGIIKMKDQFIHVTKEELDKLLKHLQNPDKLTKNQMLQVLFANEYKGEKIEISDEIKKILEQFTNNETIALPEGLIAEMRPYQLRGYEWMVKNTKIGFGSILADDMGLGKTLQTIAVLLKFKEDKLLDIHKALIIVPTTLLTNWGKELQKFAPSLSFRIYHGSKRNINDFDNQDILITSYGTARSDAAILKKLKWQVLTIDEAQNIKNNSNNQTKAIKSIHANCKIALSGTPVENRLSEYWSIFDFTNKGYLGTISNFDKEFAKPIGIERSHQHLEVFKKITSPFIMRRMKNDKSIISDLPDKIENNQYSSLTKQQAALYKSTVKNVMNSIEESEGIERKGLVLKMMIALKQIGNHPYQFLKSGSDSPNLSGKTAVLFELLNSILENNEKVLIFTQYKVMGDILQKLIREEFKTEPLFLHGSLARRAREKMVEDFQSKAHRKIFILSLKAGGTGLNLTEARNVIHYDLWWNPAVETQATDRAYRIGQKNKVIVHRLINRGTLEERIDEMISDKKELADLTVNKGEKWLGELNNKELKELVRYSNDLE